MKNIIHNIASDPYKVLITFVLLALLIYIPIFQIGYISDDWGFVYQMEHAGWYAFKYNFTDRFFIPLSHVLGTIQYKLSGGNSTIQHIIQVILHSVIAWQIYLLCKDISKRVNNKDLIPIGVIAGLLFLINPFQVESVAWLAAKSYGYTLLFSILALRVLVNQQDIVKQQIIFWVLTLFAILSKEWAFVLPFIAFFLMKLIKINIPKSFWIGLVAIFSIAITLRFFVLGTLVGGYENGHSFELSTTALHIAAYFVKFTTYIRLASTEFLPLPIVMILSSVLVLFFITIIIRDKIKKLHLFYFICIITLSILPVAGLEITSFLSNQSDRYSYFALVPFSILYGYVIVNLKKWFGLFSLFAIVSVFAFKTVDYNIKWQKSSAVQYSFLESLLPNVSSDTRVFLYNIPDTFNDIYCIRNGIEPYLKVNGKIVDIEVYQRQDLYDVQGGSMLTAELTFETIQAENTYTTFPKDVISKNRISFDWEWLNEFDKSFTYANETFTLINNPE